MKKIKKNKKSLPALEKDDFKFSILFSYIVAGILFGVITFLSFALLCGIDIKFS